MSHSYSTIAAHNFNINPASTDVMVFHKPSFHCNLSQILISVASMTI